jgi:hypothetical protein
VVSGDLKPHAEIEAAGSAIEQTRKRLYAAIKPGALLLGHASGTWHDFVVYAKKGRRFVIGLHVPDGYRVVDLNSRHRPHDDVAAHLWQARNALDSALQHRDAVEFWKDRIEEAGWADKDPAPTDDEIRALAHVVEAAQDAWAEREEEIRQERRAKRFEAPLSRIISEFQTGLTIEYPDETYERFDFNDMVSLHERSIHKSLVRAKTQQRGGKVVRVRAYTDRRTKKPDEPAFKEKRTTPEGNVQYLYDEVTLASANAEKFRRAVQVAQQIPEITRDVKKALQQGDTPKDKVIAAIVALIDRCQFRIGTEKYAEEHGTFGVTTLKPEHVTVSGRKVRFQFTGKKQVPWDKVVTDTKLAEFVGHLAEDGPGDRLFWYHTGDVQHPIKASHVNDYLRGYGITAKDFRTYHATRAMFEQLQGLSSDQPLPKKEVKERVKQAFEVVAERMGHTPAVCRTSYVLPEIVADYEANGGRLTLPNWESAAS